MNAGTIAQFLKLSPEKTAALEKAWGVASAAAQGVSSREDAMRVLAEQNVGADVLDKAAGYLNSLRGATNNQQTFTPPQSGGVDAQMDALRKGLQQLK